MHGFLHRFLLIACVALVAPAAAADDLGRLSANPYAPDSVSNPYSPAGSPYSPTSVRNPYGQYGSPYSNESATNPYASDPPKLYDQAGRYRGELSANPHAPDSIANPYGRYGSPYSPDSVNNPYGAGNPYAADSPTNPHGSGWRIVPGNQATPGAATTPRVVVPAAPAFSILNALDGPEDDHSGTDW